MSREILQEAPSHLPGHITAAIYEFVQVPVVRCAFLRSSQLPCPLELAFINSTRGNHSRPPMFRPLNPSGAIHPLLPPGRADLIPVEILSEIFLLVLQDWPWNKVDLVLVCQRWYAIMLSMPGITSRLRIRRATKKEVVQAFIQGRKTRFVVVVDVNDEGHGGNFNADDFHASLLVAGQAASRWRSLELRSFPPPGEYKAPVTIAQPLESLRGFILDEHCDLGSFFEPLMTAITTTAPPHFTRLDLFNLRAVLYLVEPACLHIFCSLTILTITLSKRMESPADILPHLQRLERFHAQHLHLPIYSPDVSLPLIQTLRELSLKSVSVQWMAGKAFPVLRRCSITFPHHIDTICLRPVTMPDCTYLTYDSNALDPLRHFHHPPLAWLEVTSGQWNVRRGNLQFVTMCPIIFASAQSLSTLKLQVQCSEQPLVLALRLLLALEHLELGLASPHALSATFFQEFVATNSNADSPCEMAAMPRLPLCAKLRLLKVRYKRWLRGPERKALISVFSDIVSSRPEEERCCVILGFEPRQFWLVGEPVNRILEATYAWASVIGISSLYGIIPLELVEHDSLTEVPFKEAEYLVADHQLPFSCLLTLHNLMELRVGDEQYILTTAPPSNMPLFHTLKVFEAKSIHPSSLAGQTFHKLERCRVSLNGEGPKPSQAQVTHMPVCTRLDVDDLTLLATFKLPQIHELGASFDHPEFSMIWEKHIAVNANLSGLELLHVYGQHQQADLIHALRFLPALKSLIVGNGSDLDADFFGEFVPLRLSETAVLTQSHNEGQVSAVLCPMLWSLLIEGCDLTRRLALTPVFKQVVTLRAVCGSRLERFTLFDFGLGTKTELIGGHGKFVVEIVVLGENAEPFRLDI
jgi:hypothetical protein